MKIAVQRNRRVFGKRAGKKNAFVLTKRSKPNRMVLADIINIGILIIVAAFMSVPLIYMISNAFKPLDEFFIFPPRFLVKNPTLENFTDLPTIIGNTYVPFTRYLFNTFFITFAGTVGHVIVASLAAFTISKYRAPGMNAFFKLVIMTLMFAGSVTAIPNYIIMSSLKWTDTYFSLIVPAIGGPLGLFLMKQFMDGLPDSLIEAAKMDGTNIFFTFWHIAMPNVKPGWITLAIFSFQSLWGTTGGIFIYKEQLKPLPYVMSQIMTGGIARAGVGAAISLLMLAVPLMMFVVSQSNIMETMASSGIKD